MRVNSDLTIYLTMINGLGQLALVAVLYGMIRRLEVGRRARSVALGCLFGSGAIIAMICAHQVMPGVLVDTRAIMVGLAGAFAGVPAGLIAGVIAAAFRYCLGGVGAPFGMIGIGMATVAGIAWYKLLSRRRRDRLSGLVFLAVGISLHSLLAIFSSRLEPGFLMVYFPLIWTTCLLATLTLGWMMQRENAQIQREKSLNDFAYTDPLTGLANRRAFDRRMQHDDVQAADAHFALVMIDVDNFKAINDRFGHEAGDDVLRSLARMVQNHISDLHLVARFGGEEFVILLPATDLGEARLVADQIRTLIAARPFTTDNGSIRVTASFGVVASSSGIEQRALMAAADAALYRAKAMGRNRVEIDIGPNVLLSGALGPQPIVVAPAI